MTHTNHIQGHLNLTMMAQKKTNSLEKLFCGCACEVLVTMYPDLQCVSMVGVILHIHALFMHVQRTCTYIL